MAVLNLGYIDELIAVRRALHGGSPGAPPVQSGIRQGEAINRSCIVMLSALLQSYIEEVYHEAAKKKFPNLASDPDIYDSYWKSFPRWGNPSDVNIQRLFLRLGISDVFDGLSWQKAPTDKIKRTLNILNQLRNGIAHGRKKLTVNNKPRGLELRNAEQLARFANQFGKRFEDHALSKL